jgi:hypothetical protein
MPAASVSTDYSSSSAATGFARASRRMIAWTMSERISA